jgi:hypothetical protein
MIYMRCGGFGGKGYHVLYADGPERGDGTDVIEETCESYGGEGLIRTLKCDPCNGIGYVRGADGKSTRCRECLGEGTIEKPC